MLRRCTTAERRFSQGQRLVAQQQYDAAVEAFAQALALRPRAVGIALHQALALAETGQTTTAIATLQEAMTWQPSNPVLPLFLGQICFDAADYGQARHWCTHALTLAPDNPYALALQALVDIARGQIAQGYARLKQPVPVPTGLGERAALRLSHRCPPTLIQGANTALNSRLLLCAEAYLRHQETPVRTLSHQLVELSPSGLASRCLASIDRLCTHSVMGLQRLAFRLRYLGQPAARTRQLRQAAAAEAYYLGDVATARALYSEILQGLPEHYMARQRLFEVCYEQGDFGAALAALRVLAPDNTARPAWQAGLLGELLAVAGRYSEASGLLLQAARQGLQDYKLFYYLGVCQVHQGAYPQARRWFAQAAQLLNPGLPELRLDEMYRVYTLTVPPPPACPTESPAFPGDEPHGV
jgi:tetratricopeptide (TPR) repeat protein